METIPTVEELHKIQKQNEHKGVALLDRYEDDKKLKVVLGGVFTMCLVLVASWAASKGSFYSIPIAALSVMSFQSTLIQKYK